jgi:hypothetical protein
MLMSGILQGEVKDGNRVVFIPESIIKHDIYYTAVVPMLRTSFQ